MVVHMITSGKYIEIVRSTDRELSYMSQKSCNAIFAVLAKHYTRVGITIVNNQADLESLVARRPDLVFLGMEFIPAHPHASMNDPAKIWLSTYLDQHDVTHTGSGQMALELGRDKSLAKQCMVDAGLKTSSFRVIKQGQTLNGKDVSLAFPLFVKPTNRGGGIGIDGDSVVYTFEQLYAKVCSISRDLHAGSLIEEYLPGREFSVAILQDEHSTAYSVMPIELIAPPNKQGARILSQEVKSANVEQAVGVTDSVIKAKVTNLAIDAFHALGARDYGRIDIRLDNYGTPHFLEANLLPSLISGYGSFPKACMLNTGLEYERMILRIAQLGLARNIEIIEGATESISISNLAFPLAEVAFEAA
jgi:D-alanine-D-alanine ligase